MQQTATRPSEYRASRDRMSDTGRHTPSERSEAQSDAAPTPAASGNGNPSRDFHLLPSLTIALLLVVGVALVLVAAFRSPGTGPISETTIVTTAIGGSSVGIESPIPIETVTEAVAAFNGT